MKNRKSILIFVLKLSVSIGLLGYLVTRIDGEQFAHTLASA